MTNLPTLNFFFVNHAWVDLSQQVDANKFGTFGTHVETGVPRSETEKQGLSVIATISV